MRICQCEMLRSTLSAVLWQVSMLAARWPFDARAPSTPSRRRNGAPQMPYVGIDLKYGSVRSRFGPEVVVERALEELALCAAKVPKAARHRVRHQRPTSVHWL